MSVSRRDVLEVAGQLVDEDGLDGLTMRRLAARLGVTPMALYNHAADKDDVITGVVDVALDQLPPPDPEAPWEAQLRAVFTSLRDLYLRRPNLLPLILASRTATPSQVRPMVWAMQALEDAGASRDVAAEAWSTLVGFTNGHAAYQLRGHLAGSPPETRPPMPAGMMAVPPVDYDHAFGRALGSLLAGIRDHSGISGQT